MLHAQYIMIWFYEEVYYLDDVKKINESMHIGDMITDQ